MRVLMIGINYLLEPAGILRCTAGLAEQLAVRNSLTHGVIRPLAQPRSQ